MKEFRLSFLLHILLLLSLAVLPVTGGGKGEGENAEGQGGANRHSYADVTIVDPPSKTPEVIVNDQGELEALLKRAPHAADKCEKFYGGIGIVDSFEGVKSVYPGYPAHKAGIQVGDEIQSTEEIRGEVGTPVTVIVLRGFRRITFNLVRDKICVL